MAKVKSEPTMAPQIPANSGSRLSPLVKKRRLKTLSIRPSAIQPSTQAICWSLKMRSDSGTSRGMSPFMSMSTSSETGTDRLCRVPSHSGLASTSSRNSKAAPEDASA